MPTSIGGKSRAFSQRHQGRIECGVTGNFFAATSPKTRSTARRSYDVLLCLGLDHDHAKFTHKFRGLNTRLTGVEEAHVVKAIRA